jgi:hypothetical protein
MDRVRSSVVPRARIEWLLYAKLQTTWEPTSRNRLTGGDCKPVYAADIGNILVVNDTLKRQRELSGADTGDERE